MIGESALLHKTNVSAQQKNCSWQDVMQMLSNSGWINRHIEEDDLVPSLLVLIEALGINREVDELCAALPWYDEDKRKNKTLDLTGMLNTLAELGFIAHELKLSLENLDPRLCPCLFVSGDKNQENVITVLDFDEEKKIFNIFDAKRQSYEERPLSEDSAGVAWIFLPEEDVQNSLSENVREASGHGWFRALVTRFSNGLWQVIAIGAMLMLLSLAAPIFVMLVYDRVISAHAPDALVPLLAGALLALSTEAALRLVRAHVLSWYGARLDYIVGSQVFERLMCMPVIFTERASVAAQIARIRAFDAVRDFFTGAVFLAMAELPFTLILIAAIALISGPIAFIPLISAVFYILLIIFMRSHVRTAMRLASKANSVKQEMTIETFEKMDGLRAGGLTSIWFRDFRDLSGKASLAGFRAGFLASIVETFSYGIFILAGLSVLVLGVIQIWEGSMSPGALIAVVILTWRVLGPMQTLCNALPRYEQLNNAVAQINRLMTIETEGTDSKVTARLSDLKGEIDFQKVGLRYTKDNDPVFTGLSFVARPGEMVAVTGGNGAGKSTVLKLINGLYYPQAGAIHIDGIDIRQLEPQHLRRNIAYVPQSPSVFHGSVADNLRFANPLATDEQLRAVLEQVDLWSYVEKLPLGMHTTIGKHGAAQLPTGLSYNLNLARAYIKDTSILLIDEMPYAFLNSLSGHNLRTTLETWKGKKTMVVVTHREDYLALADKVVLLRPGQSALIDTPEKIIRTIYDSQEAAYA